MGTPILYKTTFPHLSPADSVAEATRRMLADDATDLPVVNDAGKLLGLFRLDRLYASLLPKAVLLGLGVPDLRFMSDTLDELRERMAEIADRPVSELMVQPEHVAAPDASPFELVHLMYKGANNVPVVEPKTGKLVGMVSARDVLAALVPSPGGA